MVDTPTTNYGLRQQARGTNTNTWGDTKLNEVEQGIDQIFGTIKTIPITGDYTITSTNYVITADNKNAGFKFTGVLTGNATITLPTVNAKFKIINATTGGFSLLVKTSAGATVTVPSSAITTVYTNAVDALVAADNYIGARLQGVTAGTAATDATNKAQVEAAIAAAGLPSSAGTIFVDLNDTTPDYLINKLSITGSGAITVTPSVTNPSGNEVRAYALAVGSLALTLMAEQTAGFTASAGKRYPCNFATAQSITMPASATLGDVIEFEMYGTALATWLLNGLKYYGQSTNPASASAGVQAYRYTNSTQGWIDI